jgi:hypothetical protein
VVLAERGGVVVAIDEGLLERARKYREVYQSGVALLATNELRGRELIADSGTLLDALRDPYFEAAKTLAAGDSKHMDFGLSFLETNPEFYYAEHVAERLLSAMWVIDDLDSFTTRIQAICLQILDRGTSYEIDAAARLVSRVWDTVLDEEVERRRAEAQSRNDIVESAVIDRFVAIIQRHLNPTVPLPMPGPPENHDPEMARALRQLADILPTAYPSLWKSFNPPATSEQIAELKSAIEPFPLPAAVETWLRFANGQKWGSVWWPDFDGPMMDVKHIIEHYTLFRTEFTHEYPPALMRISTETHYGRSIELISTRTPAILDTGMEYSVVAPSFVAAVESLTEALRRGLIREDDPDDEELREQRKQLAAAIFARHGWMESPYPPGTQIDFDTFPVEWWEPMS